MSFDAETIEAALRGAERTLSSAQDEHPRLSAEWLLSEVCGCRRGELHLHRDRVLDAGQRERYQAMVGARASGEPLQYIAGRAPFRSLELGVDRSVLIPRPETEVLVSVFLNAIDAEIGAMGVRSAVVADIGCGSGCIACALAVERPELRVLATDVSKDALDRARVNAKALSLDDTISFYQGDMLAALSSMEDHGLAGIISNPPYIPTAVLATLPREVIEYEPRAALDGGEDGLFHYRSLVREAPRLLRPDGVLAVELFETTLDAAAELAREAGFSSVEIHRDLAGRDRIVLARLG